MVGLQLKIPEPQDDEDPATAKQRGYIRALCNEVGLLDFPEEVLENLGKWQASSIIDQIKSFKKELAGEKPLDTSRIEGLEESRSTWLSSLVLAVVGVLVVVLLLFLRSSL